MLITDSQHRESFRVEVVSHAGFLHKTPYRASLSCPECALALSADQRKKGYAPWNHRQNEPLHVLLRIKFLSSATHVPLLQQPTFTERSFQVSQCRVFLDEMSRMLASDLLAIVAANRLTEIGQDFSRGLVVRGTASVDKLRRFAQPCVGILHHLLHPILPLAFPLGRFTLCRGLAFFLFFCCK